MPVTRQEFRDAMARLGAAVNIITTAGPAGRGGFTASAVCSVTDDPPTLLVCVNRGSNSGAVVKANGALCVNTLAAGQQELSAVFAGATKCSMEDRFLSGNWGELVTGAPVLQDAVVAFDCRIADMVEKGSHTVLFAEIEAIRQGSRHSQALIYYARDYHGVGEPIGEGH
jgi:flavin reductase